MGVGYPCAMCNGSGVVSAGKGKEKVCPQCEGEGLIGYTPRPDGVCAFFCPIMKGV